MTDSTKAGLRVLVCGGRDFAEFERAFGFLDAHHERTPFDLVITGLDPLKPRGADRAAYEWATRRGLDTVVFPANWPGLGRPAGPARNRRMLREGRPDLVIAFPGGRGTADMIAQAGAAGVRVVEAGRPASSRARASGIPVEREGGDGN